MPSKASDAIKNCVYIFDSKTGKTRPADEKSTLKGKTECFVLSITIFVKDFSTLHYNQANTMHIVDSSTSGEHSFFPGITPQDLLKNKKAQAEAT